MMTIMMMMIKDSDDDDGRTDSRLYTNAKNVIFEKVKVTFCTDLLHGLQPMPQYRQGFFLPMTRRNNVICTMKEYETDSFITTHMFPLPFILLSVNYLLQPKYYHFLPSVFSFCLSYFRNNPNSGKQPTNEFKNLQCKEFVIFTYLRNNCHKMQHTNIYLSNLYWNYVTQCVT